MKGGIKLRSGQGEKSYHICVVVAERGVHGGGTKVFLEEIV